MRIVNLFIICTLVSLSINSHHHLVGLAAMSSANLVNGHAGSDPIVTDPKDTVSGKKNQENHVDLVSGEARHHKVKGSYSKPSAQSNQKLKRKDSDVNTGGSNVPVTKPNQATATNATNSATVVKPAAATTTQPAATTTNATNSNSATIVRPTTATTTQPAATTTNATNSNSATIVRPTTATTTQPAASTQKAPTQTVNATTKPNLGVRVNIPTTPTNLNKSGVADLSKVEAATADLINSMSTKSLKFDRGLTTNITRPIIVLAQRRQLFQQKANPRRRLQTVSQLLEAPKKPKVQAITAQTIKDILSRITSGTTKALNLYNSTKSRVSNLKSSLGKEQAWVKSNLSSFVKSSQSTMTDVNKMLSDINTAFGQQQGQVNPSTTKDDLGVPLKKGDTNAQDIIKKAKDVQASLKKFWSIAKIGMAKVKDLRKVIKQMSALAKGNMKAYLDGMAAKMSIMHFNLPAAPAATPAKSAAAPAKPAAKSKASAKKLKAYFDDITAKMKKIDFKLPAKAPLKAKVPAKRLLRKLPIKY